MALDPMLGLPVFLPENVVNLSLTEDAVILATQPTHYSYKMRSIRVYRDRYVDQVSMDKINIANGISVDRYRMAKIPSDSDVVMPAAYSSLALILEKLVETDNKHGVINISDVSLSHVVSFFTLYSDFGPIYIDYKLNPDDGITFSDEVSIEGVEWVNGPKTKASVKATAHLFILMMCKSFPRNQASEHIRAYLENRLTAIKNILGKDSATFMVNSSTISKLPDLWNRYPKLKMAIFFMLRCLSTHEEVSTALMLLADSSVVSIQCVNVFLRAKITTVAHLYPEIMEEALKYLDAQKGLKDRLGQLWPFYRTIEAKDTTLAAVKFPNLTVAAIIYNKHFVNTTAAFQRIQEPRHNVVEGLREAAKERLPERMLKGTNPGLPESYSHLRGIAEQFGLDVSKWIMPDRLRLRMRRNYDYENEDGEM